MHTEKCTDCVYNTANARKQNSPACQHQTRNQDVTSIPEAPMAPSRHLPSPAVIVLLTCNNIAWVSLLLNLIQVES